MNLHEWITARVEAVEDQIRTKLIGWAVAFVPNDGGKILTATVTDAEWTPSGFQLTAAQYPLTPHVANPDAATDATILRRCEADRRVLARHRLPAPDEWLYPGCAGCGTEGHMDDPVSDNINDCPELLDLAHAHGVTEDALAALDRPQPAPRAAGPVIGHASINITAAMTTDQVPAALRGGAWRRNHH